MGSRSATDGELSCQFNPKENCSFKATLKSLGCKAWKLPELASRVGASSGVAGCCWWLVMQLVAARGQPWSYWMEPPRCFHRAHFSHRHGRRPGRRPGRRRGRCVRPDLPSEASQGGVQPRESIIGETYENLQIIFSMQGKWFSSN